MTRPLLITGASSGIGRELAVQAEQRGVFLSLCGRNEQKLAQTQDMLQYPQKAFCRAYCLTAQEALDEFVEQAVQQHGPVSVLINCAGLNNVRAPGAETTIQQMEGLMQVNCYAPIACIQAVLPSMLQRGCGTVVNVLSTVCLYANPGIAAYTASKAALDGYTKVMRKELKGQNIKFISVYPGGVNTEFREADRPQYLEAGEVARAILNLLDTAEKTHIHELVIRPQAEDNFC
ncbi:SDR family NAD(P)-dependent oxidoreductase [Alteromonas aestuariivivens]|uniref:SDR family NAD(P)-dependent oxidoreductase n=1 Tax=Alteromonas aestuariivivens TaxID=1938339 RepID=A0A3D8M3G1_9ALTE|nr:SDR family oxidoreductase [Alteromonas aestuariivivens]RDV24171.1 SDR family NAD(P)-dependent oxidoreductase [Alteromonas aestuariivivens]